MSTILVALTVLDHSADQLVDTLAATFPISAFRGSPGVWLVEVEQDAESTVDQAEERVGRALSSIRQEWDSVITLGATGDGVQAD